MKNSNTLMVYVECDEFAPINVSLEALSKGVELGKTNNLDVIAVLIGKFDESTEKICKDYGVHKIVEVAIDQYNIQSYGDAIVELINKYSPKLLISPTASIAKDIISYAGAKLSISCIAGVSKLEIQDKIHYTTSVYGGAVLQDICYDAHKTDLVFLANGAFKKELSPVDSVEIIKEDLPKPSNLYTIIKESVTEIAETVNLEEAEVIISCGRGMGTPEGLALVEELAKVLGGAIGATRPVTESGLVARTQQVGQSGKIVSPKLYIGCGVSGATQHVSGILGSDYIVAINKDEDAPIFEVSDVGIVGNGMDVLPIFIEEIKKVKNS